MSYVKTEEEVKKAEKKWYDKKLKKIALGLVLAIIPYFIFRKHISDLPMSIIIGLQVSFGLAFLMKWEKSDFTSTTRYLFAMLLHMVLPVISVLLMLFTWDTYKVHAVPTVAIFLWLITFIFSVFSIKDSSQKK